MQVTTWCAVFTSRNVPRIRAGVDLTKSRKLSDASIAENLAYLNPYLVGASHYHASIDSFIFRILLDTQGSSIAIQWTSSPVHLSFFRLGFVGHKNISRDQQG